MTLKHTLAVVMIALAVVTGGAAVVAAQEATPPGEPVAFYGAIEDTDGTLAPSGTTIVAVAIDSDGDTSVEGSITVAPAGQYGGGGATDDKLRVDSNAGAEVRFHVGGAAGPVSESSYSLDPGVFEQRLTFPAGEFDTVTASATIDDSGQAVLSFPDPDASEGITQATISLPDGVPATTRVSVQPSPGPTGGADARGPDAIYMDITPSNPVDGSTEISVDIQPSTLDSFDDPTLFRYDGSSWNQLDTSVNGNTITATSPNGLSPFAVSEPESPDAGGGGGGGGGGGSATTETPTPTPTPAPTPTATAEPPAQVTPTPDGEPTTAAPAPAPLPTDGLSLLIVGLIAAAILLIAFIALRLR
jgi:hypothetical protein